MSRRNSGSAAVISADTRRLSNSSKLSTNCGTGTRFACCGFVKVPLGSGIMPSAKEYRAYVEKCIGWAEGAKTDDERDIFLQMAKGWLEAALIASGASPGQTAWTKSPSDEDGSATAVSHESRAI
jgi:hypothetical protein